MKLADIISLEQLNESNNENKNIGKAPAQADVNPYMTTAQAGKELGVSQSRVRQFIMDGRLKSKGPKKGRRDNMLSADEIHKFGKKARKQTGRPKEK